MKYAVILFDNGEKEYHCLIETLSVTRSSDVNTDFLFVEIKRVLNPENELIHFKKIGDRIHWAWLENFHGVVSVSGEYFRDAEFLDDETALFWFKLNYGG